jgi:hypothetical protein
MAAGLCSSVMNVRGALLGGSLALAALLAWAPSAFGFGLTPSVQPQSAPAGSNSDLQINIEIQQPEQDLKDLTIHLPPGLVGNPLVAPQCTADELNADACPPASDVGDVVNNVTVNLVPPITQDVEGDVYNLVPETGEPARFGIRLEPPIGDPIVLQSPAQLRQSDFGLDTLLTDLPRTANLPVFGPTDIDINSVELTLQGRVNDLGFIRLPTSCKEHTVGFDANSYDGGPASAQTTFTTTDCGALPFSPELKATAKPQGLGEPIELTTTISQTIEEAGLAHAQVILPTGITGNNELLGTPCPRVDFFAGSCPANTIIGTALAGSPLQLQPLTGTVALIEPAVPGLPDIGLDLRGPLALKLTGSLALGGDGRAIATFAGLPDIPIADFKLTFTREASFVIAGVDLCASPPLIVDGLFRAHSGAETAVQAPIELEGCAGGKGKKPKAKVKLGKLGSDEPKLKLTVKAGAERMRTASLKLPKQLGFASGKDFKRGTKAKANGKKLKGKNVKHTERALKLKGKRAKRFVAKVAGGALQAADDARRRMRFKVKVVDVRGGRTTLAVKSK